MAGDRTSFMSAGTESVWSEDLWENEDDISEPTRSTKRKDEPMSPVVVVLYVVFFYIVWQILTRSDDNEILSHLPSGSPLLSSIAHTFERALPSPQQQQQYHLPYALQQVPSPAPANAESSSTWRIVLSTIVYPIYILVTLIAIPLPFLITALNLVFNVASTILYPITSTARLITRTFVLAPFNVVMGFLRALYPVYVFVGGVVGAGAFLGVTFGYAGRLLLSLLVPPRASSKRKRSRRSSRRRSSSGARHEEAPVEAPVTARAVETVSYAPVRERPRSTSYERRYVPIVDVIEIDSDLLPFEKTHTTAHDGVVLGVRRRSARIQ